MLNCKQLRSLIIVPALSDLQCYSKEAEELLVFTCAAESNGGTYLKQINGPALGIYQCEPETHTDIWINFIHHRSRTAILLQQKFNVVRSAEHERLIYDLRYATAMARCHYLRIGEALPKANDINAIWDYYKLYYNTPGGAADKENSIKKYQKFTK